MFKAFPNWEWNIPEYFNIVRFAAINLLKLLMQSR